MNKDEAIEIKNMLGTQLDDVVRELIDFRNRGENVYTIFNGQRLYSADVTMDSAYIQVCGMDKKTFDELQKKEQREWKMHAEKNIPVWIKKGKEFIPKELWEEWEACVEIRAKDLYNGMELDCVIEIFEGLKNKTLTSKHDVELLLDKQGHTRLSYGTTKSILVYFSKDYNALDTTKKSKNNADNRKELSY